MLTGPVAAIQNLSLPTFSSSRRQVYSRSDIAFNYIVTSNCISILDERRYAYLHATGQSQVRQRVRTAFVSDL